MKFCLINKKNITHINALVTKLGKYAAVDMDMEILADKNTLHMYI